MYNYIYLVIVHTLGDSEAYDISWDQINNFLQLLGSQSNLRNTQHMIFSKYDLNNDGLLSLSQFFLFVQQTPQLWEPLYEFRKCLIATYFTEKRVNIILERKSKIKDIKTYRLANDGKFPHTSCIDYLKLKVFKVPFNNYYTYEPNIESLSLTTFLSMYVSRFVPKFNLHKEKFNVKYLTNLCPSPVLSTIDFYYTLYRGRPLAPGKSGASLVESFNLARSSKSILVPRSQSKRTARSSRGNNNSMKNSTISDF